MPPQIISPELEKRVKGFNEALMPILKKYQLGIGAVAFMLPDGRIGARLQIIDDTKKVEEETLAKA